MAISSDTGCGPFREAWWQVVLTKCPGLKRWGFWHPNPASVDDLDTTALKDIGFHPGDLPAMRNGQLFSGPTRIQR